MTAMRSTQLVGLLLWRGGLLATGGWILYQGLTLILRSFDLPAMIEVGLGLVLSGAVLVVVSLVLERIADARAEGDLLT